MKSEKKLSRSKAKRRPAASKAAAARPQIVEADSAARALNILGDRWILMIVSAAFSNVRRFEDFKSRIGIARSILTDRLRKLEDAGIFRREQYSLHPPRDEYRLTEMGRDLFGPALMIIRWEKRWFYNPDIPAHQLKHAGCGKPFLPEYRCKNCDQVVNARDCYAEPGPGAGVDPAQRPRAQRRSVIEATTPDNEMMKRAIEVLGDRWTSHVIASAFLGRKRFSEFQQALSIAPNILTDRLNKLVELGVLDQRQYQNKPARWEYRLSEQGRDLFPLILELVRWGDRWLAGAEGPPRIIHHKPCGQPLEAVIKCDQCHDTIGFWQTVS